MRKTIGLIAGAFKPLTMGHWHLIELASNECDIVYLFVSQNDRVRLGEFPIYWSQMQLVWDKYLLKVLPSNVVVEFVKTPIKNVMDILIEANSDINNYNTYMIYSDPKDRSTNFPDRALQKYMSRLIANDQVIFRDIRRENDGSGGSNVSGTLLRSFLQNGDVESFIAGLPKPVRPYGQKIYKILGGK